MANKYTGWTPLDVPSLCAPGQGIGNIGVWAFRAPTPAAGSQGALKILVLILLIGQRRLCRVILKVAGDRGAPPSQGKSQGIQLSLELILISDPRKLPVIPTAAKGTRSGRGTGRVLYHFCSLKRSEGPECAWEYQVD